jgi:phosphoglucosamine mutase
LFGTDGVRGRANVEPMTTETVLRLGRAIAAQGARRHPGSRAVITIGRDTRRSGAMLEAALAAGVASAGADAVLVGVLPTPAVSFLTRNLQAAAGAVVSASHNPFEDNGVKFFDADGFKLAEADEQVLEDFITGSMGGALPTGADVGVIRQAEGAARRYSRFLRRQLPKGFHLDGLRVAIDCAHGAAFRIGPRLFEDLGAKVTALGVSPDGHNINRDHGAMHPENLQAVVRREGADVGLALDGDADRLLLVDSDGDLVDGDEILGILALDLVRRGQLRGNVVVGTVMSNLGLEVALRKLGVSLIRAAVGDRYVVEQMRRHAGNLGGESSGHIVLLDQHTTGDGLQAALAIFRIMRESGRTLAALRGAVMKFPQVLRNVRVNRRHALEDLPALRTIVDRITAELAGRGRVLVRFSGTEPVVRVMVEGEQQRQVESFAEELAAVVQRCLGAPSH